MTGLGIRIGAVYAVAVVRTFHDRVLSISVPSATLQREVGGAGGFQRQLALRGGWHGVGLESTDHCVIRSSVNEPGGAFHCPLFLTAQGGRRIKSEARLNCAELLPLSPVHPLVQIQLWDRRLCKIAS